DAAPNRRGRLGGRTRGRRELENAELVPEDALHLACRGGRGWLHGCPTSANRRISLSPPRYPRIFRCSGPCGAARGPRYRGLVRLSRTRLGLAAGDRIIAYPDQRIGSAEHFDYLRALDTTGDVEITARRPTEQLRLVRPATGPRGVGLRKRGRPVIAGATV